MIEGKPQACIALLPLWLKLRDLAEPYVDRTVRQPLNKDKEHARHPLIALTALIAQVFREPESSIAGPACFGLS